MAEPTPMNDRVRRPRGRPRPLYTIQRDQRVAEAMASQPGRAWTIKELIDEQLSGPWPYSVVYFCVLRLRWGGMAEKIGRDTYRRTALPFHSDVRAPRKG